MKVSLVAHTTGIPGTITEGMTIGQVLACVARVSNPGNQTNSETSEKLLKYCLSHGHWSVFETCHVTLEIVTSRAISQQMIRHWSSDFHEHGQIQEFSLRYAEAAEFETYEARSQDHKNRQNSINDMLPIVKSWFVEAQHVVQSTCLALYQQAIAQGIAKEQARMLLPLSTQTTFYMTGNVRSWITYCRARCAPGVQKEHQDIAFECRKILLELIPELTESF